MPTKRYLKIMQKINQSESVEPMDVQKALMNELWKITIKIKAN